MAESALAKFEITKGDDGFTIHIEDEAGGSLVVVATDEQLDVISDTLIELLEADSTADDDDGI